MTEIEIGRGKRARVAYSFDDVSLVPSRRTREPDMVSLSWKIDAYTFAHPLIAAPMDSVVSPTTASTFAAHGGLAILNLEGLWTRYENPKAQFEQIAKVPVAQATAKLQSLDRKSTRLNSSHT